MPKIGSKRSTAVDVEVGHRIPLQRKHIGMSQTELPNAVGVTFQQVQKYENGTKRVGWGGSSQIDAALKLLVSSFFFCVS